MNSINQQQPEDNYKDLSGTEAIEKMKELADKQTCFFCTNAKAGLPFSTRPMSVQQIDDEGNFWFLSANDSGLNKDLSIEPFAQLLFHGSSHSDFLNLHGTVKISEDKEKIKELWQPILKTWFTEGENDPRISVIKIEPTEGYYWDNKHGNAIAFVKMLAGAVIGKTLDDSVEGKVVV
jgi:general stress protein 26